MHRPPPALMFIWLALALLVRLTSLPRMGFFCDVPASMAAIESGRMHIQFPGYVPYHLLAAALTTLTGNAFQSLLLLSLAMGMGAVFYALRLGYDRWGPTGMLAAFIGIGISPLAVYVSVIGASYAADMLTVAAVLFHGNRLLAQGRTRDFHAALAWFAVGVLLRPLSVVLTGLALVYLLRQCLAAGEASTRRSTLLATTCIMGVATVTLYMGLSLPYYGTLRNFMLAAGTQATELHGTSLLRTATNLFRFAAYPTWGLHLFMVMSGYWVIRHRDTVDRKLAVCGLLLASPYLLLLLRYIPHAAYYALLLPVLTAAPMLTRHQPDLGGNRSRIVLACLLIVFPLQWYLAPPVATTNSVRLVANAYFLQYSRTAVRDGMFETLASLSRKTGILADRVPEQRRIEDR